MLADNGRAPLRRLLAATAALLVQWLAMGPALSAAPLCTGNPWQKGWTPQWTPLFQGIDWTSACTTLLANGQPGTRTQPMNALRIDLQAPGIGFVASTASSTAQGQTASQFLCGNGAQVAVNANFGWRVNGSWAIMGLAKSAGQTISQLSSVPDATYVGPMALLITKDNQASFVEVTGQTPPALYSAAWTAVAGGPQRNSGTVPERPVPGPLMLVTDGVNNATFCADVCPPETVAGRTAVALSQDKRYLYLMAIDGSDSNTGATGCPQGTQCGASFYDEAQWLLVLGAWNALNLDGGGSTTMAMSTGSGGVKLINNPSDDHTTNCQQRTVTFLMGVTAKPLPKPFLPPGCCTVISCQNPSGSSTCQGGSGIPCRNDAGGAP
jgi:exopolysaccharide biosynthesis protein